MSLTVETTAYGAAAHRRLEAIVRARQGHDPLAPVTVVVPSNAVGLALRRQLARERVGAVSFLTAGRLAELLSASHLPSGRRPATLAVVAAAVRGVLADAPGLFADVAGHPATEEALVRAHRELRGVGKAAAVLGSSGRRLSREVHRVHRAVCRRLADRWYDEDDVAEAARRAVVAGAPAVDGLGLVVVFLPQELPPALTELVQELAHRTEVVVVVGLTGHPGADAEVVGAVRPLGQLAPETTGGSLPPAPTVHDTEVITASDADDEVRVAVRRVVAAAREGIPLERIALVYAGHEPYARLVHEHLRAAGVTFNGSAVRPLSERLLGRSLLALLDLPLHGVRRDDVCGFLASAPVRRPDGRPVPSARWERTARRAGVVGDQHWDGRLSAYAAEDRAKTADRAERHLAAGAASQPDPVSPPEPLRSRRADDAEDLRAFVLDLRRSLSERPPTWAARVVWTRSLIHRLFGDEARRAGRWTPGEAAAAAKVEAAVDRLAGLDGLVDAPDLDVFRRTVAVELDADLGRVGRLGQGVLTGPIGSVLGLELDVVVIVGLAEGSFPSPTREDSLLPDAERIRLGAVLPLASGHTERQHRHLLAAMAAGGRRRVLCFPRGDLRKSAVRVPSRWLLEVAAHLESEEVRPTDPVLSSDDFAQVGPRPWLRSVPSFAGELARMAPAPAAAERTPAAPTIHPPALAPVTAQEFRLHHLPGRGWADGHGMLAADAVVGRGVALTRARASRRFTEYDGNLSGLDVPRPSDPDEVASPTSLESWTNCPHGYFMRRLLGVRPVENPEDVLELTPLDYGSLLHGALERYHAAKLAGPPEHRPVPDRPASAADRADLRSAFEQSCADLEALGVTGRAVFWSRDRAHAWRELERVLDRDDDRRRCRRSTPVAVELWFGGSESELGTVEVSLEDGRAVRLQGSVDRLDRADDGSLVVVDYKTGKSKSFAKITDDDPLAGGTKLQLPVYALAARRWAAVNHQTADPAVRAEYWFISADESFRTIGYQVDSSVLEKFGRVVARIDQGIGAGLFPARPDERDLPWVSCHYCDPDELGTSELVRSWQRKQGAPELAPYLELLEGATSA